MTEREQIEEMAKYCCFPCPESGCEKNPCKCNIALETARSIYAAGYRKQAEGECKNERFIQYFNYYDRGCERTLRHINEYAKTNNLRIINISHYHTWGLCVLFEKAGE